MEDEYIDNGINGRPPVRLKISCSPLVVETTRFSPLGIKVSPPKQLNNQIQYF